MRRTQEPGRVFGRFIDQRLLGGLAVVLLATGCTPDSASDTADTGFTLYEDRAFTHPIGQVATFDVECVDFKDPKVKSMLPSAVNYYKVTEVPPLSHTPPALTGYVNPEEVWKVVSPLKSQCPPSDSPIPTTPTPSRRVAGPRA